MLSYIDCTIIDKKENKTENTIETHYYCQSYNDEPVHMVLTNDKLLVEIEMKSGMKSIERKIVDKPTCYYSEPYDLHLKCDNNDKFNVFINNAYKNALIELDEAVLGESRH